MQATIDVSIADAIMVDSGGIDLFMCDAPNWSITLSDEHTVELYEDDKGNTILRISEISRDE